MAPYAWSRVLVPALLAAYVAAQTLIPELSFKGPFTDFSKDGMRSMPYWRYGGVAALNEHFLRLTPDRQGKSGYVQSTQANTADTWSSTFKFRVSGQGRKLFGDGIALWFTTQPGFRSGDLHGFTDMFTGFGVIFDSYINNEPGRVHRDVLFLSSDGSSSRKAAGEHGGGNVPDPIGCAADFRYWEGRDDFSVRNASLARLTFANNKVSVHIDAHADGNWKACFENAPVAAPNGWWRSGGYMAISASTGDLADNHDVLSLQTCPEEMAFEGGSQSGYAPMISSGNPEVDEAIRTATAREAGELREKLLVLHHQLEHNFESVNDNIKMALKRLEDQEADNKKRIEQLEAKFAGIVSNEIDSSLQKRLSMLESMLSKAVDKKLNTDVIPRLSTQMGESSRSWLWPFIIAGVLVSALGAFFYQRLRYLTKRHLL